MSRLHSSIPWPRQISSTATTSSSRNCFRHNTSFRLFFRIRRSRNPIHSRLLPPPPPFRRGLPPDARTSSFPFMVTRKTRSSSLKWPLSTSPRSCSHGGSNRLTLITPSGHIFTRHRSIEVACGPCPTNHVVPESMKPTSEFPDRPTSEEPV